MIYKTDDFDIVQIGTRLIVVNGVARLFYEGGFPLSIAIDEFKSKGIVVSLLHVADQCWNNGWSSETIMKKLKGECDIDINKSMSGVDWAMLEHFCSLLEQPKRANGGYEESREMLFKYLFDTSYDEALNNPDSLPRTWIKNIVISDEKQSPKRSPRKHTTRGKKKGGKNDG